MNQKYRLSPSTIAAYFKHRCDRQYRWESVLQSDRGRAGIGWNVPRTPRFQSRPGITLLMAAGDEFEVSRLEELQQEHGPAAIAYAGIESDNGRRTVMPMPMPELAAVLRRPSPPRFVAQILIDLEATPDHAARFLRRFDLDPARVRVGTARPDLLAIIPGDERRLLRVWDFKSSQAARHEHFIQVAFYTFLLEEALDAYGLSDAYAVDTSTGVIFARQGPDSFELAPYRLAIEDFLRHRAMPMLETPANEAHYHVNVGCPMCQYIDTCRAEADAGRDLSRIAYMTSESKRRLARAGFHTHRELAQLSEDDPRWEQLRAAGHDLSMNLGRYVAVAQALDDGRPRPLGSRLLTVPAWEDVRVTLSAEYDPVTNTCFALGLKTLAGWQAGRPQGMEEVFLLENPLTTPDAEAQLLLRFLRVLNALLLRVDADNAAVAAEMDAEPALAAARRAAYDAASAYAAFKAANPTLRRNKNNGDLIARRDALQAAEKETKRALQDAEREARYQNARRQQRLHFYAFDGFDLTVLKRLVERHLFTTDAALRAELHTLVRLFPPESVMPDADSFRTIPGTVVIDALRQLVALPSPYVYDLRSVTELIPAANGRRPYAFRPPSNFVYRGTNQIAFERIHDIWHARHFQPNPRDPASAIPPEEVRRRIERAVRDKLRATDEVIQWLKRDYRDGLLLRKEPFRLHDGFNPLGFGMLDALRTFTMLETSYAELSVKHLHTLPIADRVARFECLSGLRYIEAADEPDGSLWFTFDPAARDAKFARGDFDLVLTPAATPEQLVSHIDDPLFDRPRWRHEPFKVSLVEYDLQANPPRVRLKPNLPLEKFREKVDLTAVQTLDRVYVDYNTSKTIAVLNRLGTAPEIGQHVHELLDWASTSTWRPLIDDVGAVERELAACAARSGGSLSLTSAQTRAFRGAPAVPLSLIWGPPGTGKTTMLAHLLLAYVLAARRGGRPVRILVSAFTHNAINNVLNKVAELLGRYGLGGSATLVKVQGNQENAQDGQLPAAVERAHNKALAGLLGSDAPCVIAGSTVWGIYNAMNSAGGPVQPWFDVVLIDEASQMKVAEALIAFGAARPDGAVILAGDDRQLPPIIHGDYPAEHREMLSSVFAFMRARIEAHEEDGFAARTLFQLEENFRGNEAL
ncbi:MAG TPA: AAA domain-containing protein, partial [Promineifilum sp.]|nr:AAA domain-containing protein [Promineifilum sp.]